MCCSCIHLEAFLVNCQCKLIRLTVKTKITQFLDLSILSLGKVASANDVGFGINLPKWFLLIGNIMSYLLHVITLAQALSVQVLQ